MHIFFLLVDEYLLQKSPKDGDEFQFLRNVSARWDDIGNALKVDFNFRENLLRDQSLRPEQKLDHVLNNWRESQCSDVTWKHLLDVLKSLNLNTTATKMRMFLQEEATIMKYKDRPILEDDSRS